MCGVWRYVAAMRDEGRIDVIVICMVHLCACVEMKAVHVLSGGH